MTANLPSAVIDRDDLAHRRPAAAAARVVRPAVALEAPALALMDRGEDRVEAPALAVDLDDVALPDAFGREPPGRRGPGRRRREEARLLHRARRLRGARTAARTASRTARCRRTFAARSVRTCNSVVVLGEAAVARWSAPRNSGTVAGATYSRPKSAAARAKSRPVGVATCSSNASV